MNLIFYIKWIVLIVFIITFFKILFSLLFFTYNVYSEFLLKFPTHCSHDN